MFPEPHCEKPPTSPPPAPTARELMTAAEHAVGAAGLAAAEPAAAVPAVGATELGSAESAATSVLRRFVLVSPSFLSALWNPKQAAARLAVSQNGLQQTLCVRAGDGRTDPLTLGCSDTQYFRSPIVRDRRPRNRLHPWLAN